MNNTSITSPPESLTSLRRDASVDIENKPLSERTRQALQVMTSDPDYSGPPIYFSMAGPSAPPEPRPLHQAVADWLTPAKQGETAPTDSWQSFGREDNAASFSAFLDRLRETANCKKDPSFKAQISSWLTQQAKDDALRAKTFAVATEATSSCEDRVTLTLNQMRNVQLVHDAEKGKYDNNLSELVSNGREMCRLEKLEKIARDKVSTLRFVDEIEVYLGFQNKLKESLGLTSVTKEMRFFDVSYITESDLQAAELQVKTAENEDFREWILQWAPLRSVLERAYPEDWETLNEKKVSDYDSAYRTLLDTELKPAGLTGNADAEREIGARALDSAEKAFLDGLRPLANKMLGGNLKARWP
ncbi:E3 ubiquitin-protein ligase SspH2 [Izhakiella capsodis]|uniref:RING-type E3 ubiquitin transferase n=1 Tax=Izhakiella capsodis TaxID=1367852 RepID=A0A1I4XXN2_9GAMM|nr:E3 ubiquitin-protein ligase SspH2 [Izhakiella capsodis]